MNGHQEAFKEEAYELLAELETSLLELEENPGDSEHINRVFRAMHTIKGSGSMFGFDDIAEFTHNVETVFDLVREGKIEVTRNLVNLTLAAKDQIRNMLDSVETDEPYDRTDTEEIIAALLELIPGEGDSGDGENGFAVPHSIKEIGESQPEVTYRIRFRPAQDIFASGTNPLLLLNELRELGECTITAHTEDIPLLREIDPESCYIFWDIVLTTTQGENAIRDVFIFVEDDCELRIEIIDDSDVYTEEPRSMKLGEIMVEKGDLSGDDLEKALNNQQRVGEILLKNKTVSKTAVKSALAEQEHIKNKTARQRETTLASSIRVPAEKLDKLVDLVGELVTVQARLNQHASVANDPDLVLISEEVERLTGGLRDNAMSIRMLQIGTTFSKFKRLVRDLSAELGKNIVMTTEGGETELDKTVIERLNDPLVHIIRNSIDHGIERPEARIASGKDEQGTIHLSATHSGASVLIRITDDGGGLDPERIYEKAVEKGIIAPDAELGEKDIFQLIFAQGFSTAETITDVSGRGVGMDVVRQSIEALRGSIEIDSRRGVGTEITLKLPLTLAIIDGLLVSIGEDYFVMPLSSVEECVELPKNMSEKEMGRRILNVRGDIVPYIRLRDEFCTEGQEREMEHVVIADVNGKRIGFVVDEVIGGHQTVIKNLGSAFRQVQDISGATILGDGTVALIIDVNKLVMESSM